MKCVYIYHVFTQDWKSSPQPNRKKHQPHTPWNLQSRAIQQLLQIEIGPIGNCRCLHVKRRDPISTPISNISPKKHCRLGDGCLAASCLATSFTGYQFHWLPVQLHWLPVSLAASCLATSFTGHQSLAASCLATSFTGCQFRWLPVAWLPVSLATSYWLPVAWLPVSLATSYWLPVAWLAVSLAASFAGWQFPGRQVCDPNGSRRNLTLQHVDQYCWEHQDACICSSKR